MADEYIDKVEVGAKIQMMYIRREMDYGGENDFCRGMRKALRVIENMPAADVQPVNQWISVKDRLPDESCECLGVVDGEVTEVSYDPKQKGLICVWSMCDADGFKPLSDDAITHWMPLPEPPKDGETNG